MRKRAFATILALILGVSATTPALAAKGNKGKNAPTKEKEPLLQPFVEGQGKLPPDYAGVDEKRFFELFKKQLGSLERQPKESVEQFLKRAADTEAVLKPISTKVMYAFRIAGLAASYNPAHQAYQFGGKNGYGCPASGFREGYVTCAISEYALPAESVAAGMADAAKETTHEIHGLAIPIDSLFVQDGFQLDRNKFYFNRELPLAEDKARELQGATVSVLFVGKVVAERFVNERGELLLPVVKRTRQATSYEYDVPFRVSRIVYYVQQTGEILQQVVF
jgi:hypothetical protein